MHRRCTERWITFNRVSGFLVVLLAFVWIGISLSPTHHEEMKVRETPYIFVGGHQSSGTTLMRVLLDVHPAIRCGPEPVVGEFLLQFRRSLNRFEDRLTDIGIFPDVLDDATATFLSVIIQGMGEPAPYLCHKDPRTFFYLSYLGHLFPKARFINMLRDGRAVVLSSKSRNLSLGTERLLLAKWERFVRQMQYDCQNLGSNRCLTVKYELLVLYPERMLKKVLEFLNVPWDPRLLEHEKWVENSSQLSTFDKSSEQVQMGIFTESLGNWANVESTTDLTKMTCSLLDELGYTFVGIPPNYRLLSWEQPYLDWIPGPGDLDPPLPGKRLKLPKWARQK